MSNRVRMEIKNVDGVSVTINTIFLDTGEIRQKRRSLRWLAERILQHELKTWRDKYHEDIEILSVSHGGPHE